VTTRRVFLGALVGGLLAAPLAEAQPSGKAWRVGLLDFAAPDAARTAWWKAFRERLRELGYVEGQNVVFEPRWGNGLVGRLPSLAIELVKVKVDIVVTAGSETALAAKQATRSIPIVTATGADPVELGLVESLARPGGNITGVTSIQSELAGKRLEILKQLVPRASRVAVLWDLGNHGSALSLRDAESGAKSLGIVVQGVGVRSPKDFDAAFSAIKQARAGAVLLVASPAFMGDRQRLAGLAVANRLPMIVGAKEYAEAGGLMSYGTDYPDLFRRAAAYVDKILKGAKPGDLPMEQPTKFEFVINLKTAKALGLTIPPSLLGRADEVIQ
jgi:putative tryptophan/tyrosine transport system substrate-binding protein